MRALIMATTILVIPAGTTSYTLPGDFPVGGAGAFGYAFGCGGNGADASGGSGGGGGGGGGGFGELDFTGLGPSSPVTVQVPFGGGQEPTKFNGVIVADYGRNASGATGGIGGTGPVASGGKGGNSTTNPNDDGGGGGGCAGVQGGGQAGSNSTSGSGGGRGGSSGDGTPGGAGGFYPTISDINGQNGYPSLGALTADAGGGGGGQGGGVRGHLAGGNGGNGGQYGAGGGGGGDSDSSTAGLGGAGKDSVIVIEYNPTGACACCIPPITVPCCPSDGLPANLSLSWSSYSGPAYGFPNPIPLAWVGGGFWESPCYYDSVTNSSINALWYCNSAGNWILSFLGNSGGVSWTGTCSPYSWTNPASGPASSVAFAGAGCNSVIGFGITATFAGLTITP